MWNLGGRDRGCCEGAAPVDLQTIIYTTQHHKAFKYLRKEGLTAEIDRYLDIQIYIDMSINREGLKQFWEGRFFRNLI